jgi:hypothetical protein
MGAHPKNKITRVEQGKRRAGNRPKLAKNAKHVAVPAHKKSLFSRFAAAVKGAVTAPAKKAKKAVKSTKIAATPKPVEAKPVEAAAKPAAKKAAPKATKTVKKAAAKKTE